MSYARWLEGDLYLYQHVDGYFLCCRCKLEDGWDWISEEPLDVLDHLKAHRDAGHTVPQRAFVQINKDLDDLCISDVFCPYCDSYFQFDGYLAFSPGSYPVTCPDCKVEWIVTVIIEYAK